MYLSLHDQAGCFGRPETVKIAVQYDCPVNGEMHNTPSCAEDYERLKPVYIELPGWKESTFGAKSIAELPKNAVDFIAKVEELVGVPVDIISTGPDRVETIIKRHPFEA